MASAVDPGLLERALDLRCEVLATAGQTPSGSDLDECRDLVQEAIDRCPAGADRDRLRRKAVVLDSLDVQRRGIGAGGTR